MADRSTDPTSRQKRFIRWILRGLIGMALLLVAGLITLHLTIDEQFLEHRLTQAIDNGSKDPTYRVDVGPVSVSPLGRNITIEGLTVLPDSLSTTGDSVENRFVVTVGRLQVHRPSYWRFLWRGDLTITRLTIDRPALTILSIDEKSSAFSQLASQEVPQEVSLHGSLAELIPRLEIGTLRIRDGRVTSVVGRIPAAWCYGLSMTFENVNVNADYASDSRRVLYSENIRFSADESSWSSSTNRYRLQTGAIEGSTTQGVLRLDSLVYAPTIDDELFFESIGERTTRYRLSVPSIHLNEVEYHNIVERQALIATSGKIKALELDAFVDKRFPDKPDSSRLTPPKLVAGIDQRIQIDTVRVSETDITYTIQPAHDGERGVISFTQTTGIISNLTTAPDSSSVPSTTRFELSSSVAHDGRLHVDLRIPLLQDGLPLTYRGYMSKLNPRVLNAMFLPNNGIEITGGQADSIWFHAQVEDGQASGEFHAIYTNLGVRFLDARDGDQGVRETLKSFAFRTFRLHSANTPQADEPLRTGQIRHAWERDASFMKFLWQSLRSGMIDLITR